MRQRRPLAALTAALAVLSGCAVATVATSGAPKYHGIETILLDDEMVDFRVSMDGAAGVEDVEAYARCAAAQYALIRGFGFARHVRTNVAQTGSTWRGDAIYTISAALPRGLRTIDAEVTVRDCGAQGIPTI